MGRVRLLIVCMLSTVNKNILHAPSFSMFRGFSKFTVKLWAHVRLFGRERLFRTFLFSFRRQGSSRFIHKTAKRCPLRGKIRYRNSATVSFRSSFPRKSEIHPKDSPIYTQGRRFLISDGGTLGGANILKDPPAHFSPPPPPFKRRRRLEPSVIPPPPPLSNRPTSTSSPREDKMDSAASKYSYSGGGGGGGGGFGGGGGGVKRDRPATGYCKGYHEDYDNKK